MSDRMNKIMKTAAAIGPLPGIDPSQSRWNQVQGMAQQAAMPEEVDPMQQQADAQAAEMEQMDQQHSQEMAEKERALKLEQHKTKSMQIDAKHQAEQQKQQQIQAKASQAFQAGGAMDTAGKTLATGKQSLQAALTAASPRVDGLAE